MKPTADEIRKQDIVDQLIWDDSVDANDVSVSVRNGIVHLTGIVPNYLIKRQAYNLAMYTAGVIDVIDDITIG